MASMVFLGLYIFGMERKNDLIFIQLDRTKLQRTLIHSDSDVAIGHSDIIFGSTLVLGVVGWCDGLGKLPGPGRPKILMTVGQGPTALAVGAGGGCLDIFALLYLFSPISPSLWETARYGLKYCLKGPLNPN